MVVLKCHGGDQSKYIKIHRCICSFCLMENPVCFLFRAGFYHPPFKASKQVYLTIAHHYGEMQVVVLNSFVEIFSHQNLGGWIYS